MTARRRIQLTAAQRGALVVAFATVVLAVVFANPIARLQAIGATEVRVDVSSVGDLKTGAPVRVGGVNVGKVTDIGLNPGGRSARVTLQVPAYDGRVHRDARVRLQWRTILGANWFVDLDPGHPGAGPLGDAVLPADRATTQVELDDVLTAVGGDARQGMRSIIGESARAVRTPEDVQQLLRSAGAGGPTLQRAVRALHGARRADLAGLVAAADRTVRAIDAPAPGLRGLVSDAAQVLATTGARRRELGATLRGAPPALHRTRATLARLDTTLNGVDPLVARLRRPVAQVVPTVEQVRPLLEGADRLLTQARPVLRRLRPAVAQLAVAADDGVPVLRRLGPVLQRLDQRVLPALARPDAVTGFKTYEMIGPTFAVVASTAQQFDAEGGWVTFSGSPTDHSLLTAPCQTYLADPAQRAHVQCDGFMKGVGDVLNKVLGGGRP